MDFRCEKEEKFLIGKYTIGKNHKYHATQVCKICGLTIRGSYYDADWDGLHEYVPDFGYVCKTCKKIDT